MSARSKPGVRLGPGSHRGAEAGGGRLAAVDRHDEAGAPARGVVVVDVALRRGRSGPARAMACRSHERTPMKASGRFVRCVLLDLERALAVPARTPQPQPGREQMALPRVGADVVGEQRRARALRDSVGPALLLVGHARGQIGGRPDLVVDDRALAHRRADELETLAEECLEEVVEPLTLEHAHDGHRLCRTAPGQDSGEVERRQHAHRMAAVGLDDDEVRAAVLGHQLRRPLHRFVCPDGDHVRAGHLPRAELVEIGARDARRGEDRRSRPRAGAPRPR